MGTIFQKIFPPRITWGKARHTVLREVIIMNDRNFYNTENKSSQNKNQTNSQNKKDSKASENCKNERGY